MVTVSCRAADPRRVDPDPDPCQVDPDPDPCQVDPDPENQTKTPGFTTLVFCLFVITPE